MQHHPVATLGVELGSQASKLWDIFVKHAACVFGAKKHLVCKHPMTKAQEKSSLELPCFFCNGWMLLCHLEHRRLDSGEETIFPTVHVQRDNAFMEGLCILAGSWKGCDICLKEWIDDAPFGAKREGRGRFH